MLLCCKFIALELTIFNVFLLEVELVSLTIDDYYAFVEA